MHPPPSEYDIIFAGGGTAACVTAGRLASADPTLRILIVENGRATKEHAEHIQPARWVANITDPESETFTFHSANPGRNLDGRVPTASNANCVGGASGINSLMYNRAPASDYDDWMKLGNPGWGSADLIPLAKKLETYQAGAVDSIHGSSGPLKISHGRCELQITSDFLSAAAAFPRGRAFAEDMNDFHTCDVYGRMPQFIDAQTGRRSDTAHQYIYNQPADANNNNLRIMDHARVNRVLFDADKRAVGIEYQVGGKNGGEMITAHAARLVVVSAGAYCSPAILERSGIGAKELLEKLSIPVVSDLPGVGTNYKDHYLVGPTYLAAEGVLTLNALNRDANSVFETQWLRDGTGLLATNGVEAGIKLRPNAQDLEQLGASFRARWESFFVGAPDKAAAFVGAFAGNYLGLQGAYVILYISSYPLGTGYVHIKSRDPFAPLELETALLDHEEDLLVLRHAYKWSRELARRMGCFRGEAPAGHPQFAEGSEAMCGVKEGPVGSGAPEIRYSAEDDAAIDAFHRANTVMAWHAVGTCAMRPRPGGGVVDPALNAYGVRNLKVVDLSIAPTNVGANTYHTAVLVGEKAALIIGEELGLKVMC
ncbi:GMC oxidoreductase-domain-containing protein [Mycena filopes]|nr:GMC oxidoreductase-domain-containing protein [Mycena filopes]